MEQISSCRTYRVFEYKILTNKMLISHMKIFRLVKIKKLAVEFCKIYWKKIEELGKKKKRLAASTLPLANEST